MKKTLCILCALAMMLSLTACDSDRKTEYKLSEDGKSYILYRYSGKDGENVVIPATYENLPVTAIGGGAFMDTGIKSVILPEGITTIGEYAFSGCHLLESVTLPSTLTELGTAAFNDCRKIDGVVVPDGVTDIMPGVFAACHSLKTVKLPDGLKTISDEAFSWCYSLEQITIPETVFSIGFMAFGECHNLKQIDIPDNVVSVSIDSFNGCQSLETVYIGANAEFVQGGLGAFHQTDLGTEIHREVFAFNYKLENIEVSENNPYYSSVEGNLFSKDGTELIRYSIGKSESSYTVPDSVTKIGEGAFNGCTLNGTVKLETIHVSANVTEIAQSVFIGCNNLKTVNFAGTMEQWDQAKEDTVEITTGITFEDGEETVVNKRITGDYGAFKVVCSDGEIDGKTLSGDGKDSDFNINFG